MDFNLIDLSITVRSDDALQLCLGLPLMGTAFAAACRRSICLRPEQACVACSGKDACSWNLVFGQQLSSDPSALKRFQKPSLPFVFTFPSGAVLVDGATEIECGLVVIGQAIHALDLLLDGFSGILEPLSAEILQVGTRDYQGTVQLLGQVGALGSPENLVVLSSCDMFADRSWTEPYLQLRLSSPLRLFEEGRLQPAFDFCRFARSLLRRVSSLAYYYGGCEFECDFKELSRQAAAVVCTDSHFTFESGRDRKVSGLTGYGRFQGDFSGLSPFLQAGLYLHVGKGSTFGLGAYELTESRNVPG